MCWVYINVLKTKTGRLNSFLDWKRSYGGNVNHRWRMTYNRKLFPVKFLENISNVVGSLYPFQSCVIASTLFPPSPPSPPSSTGITKKKNGLNCHDTITLSGEIIVIGLTLTHRIVKKSSKSVSQISSPSLSLATRRFWTQKF